MERIGGLSSGSVFTLWGRAERRSHSANCWPLRSNLDYSLVHSAARTPIITLFCFGLTPPEAGGSGDVKSWLRRWLACLSKLNCAFKRQSFVLGSLDGFPSEGDVNEVG